MFLYPIRRILLGGALVSLLCACVWPHPAGARPLWKISDRANLITTGGFEGDVGPWEPIEDARVGRVTGGPRSGSGSLRVVATRAGAGTFSLIPTPKLLEAELVGPVTGILQGRFRFSVWARGSKRSVGKRLRVQLNEYGGGRDDRVIAVASVRLGPRWQQLAAGGVVKDEDGSGVSVLAVLERAKRGDAFFVDDFRAAGTPRARFEPAASSDRWDWWNYVLVWVAAAAAGLAWIVYTRRSRSQTGLAGIG